jgi:hypothetical protein
MKAVSPGASRARSTSAFNPYFPFFVSIFVRLAYCALYNPLFQANSVKTMNVQEIAIIYIG